MKKKIAVLACGWSHYYIHDFVDGLKRATLNQDVDIYLFVGYNFTEFSGYPNFTGYSIFNLINYDDFDGVIILSDLIGNARVLERERLKILKSGKPAITINAKLKDISCIRVDNYSGFYEIMTHLIKEHGLKDFAYISGKETSIDIAERYKAYRTALIDNNIKINMEQVFTIQASDYEYSYSLINEMVKIGAKLPEVFVCSNDLVALGVLKVAEENNIKVPEQLKIVGYDDSFYAKSIIPSLTSVRSNAEQVGFEALNRILNGNLENIQFKMQSSPVFRRSCGCDEKMHTAQKLFTLDVLNETNKYAGFSHQMEVIEEIFTEATDVFTLLTNLEIHFSKSHSFEGNDFCIFLKSDWSSVLINSDEILPQNLSFGNQVQAIVSVQEDHKYAREVINTRDLIPNKMKTGNNNIFLFFPIYNHSYVHGYLVTKNNISLIDNHFGYVWTRTFGTSIERFRTKNMYKQMSQKFLRLSTRDALSGMLNRSGLDKLAKPFFSQNKKNGLTTVIFFVDINSMKTINDKYGHLHGDLAVKTVSAAVMEVVPKNWLCIRYGGDEFLVVGNSKNYNGEDYCLKITQMLQYKTMNMHLPYNLSASVGTYSIPPNSILTLEQAIEKVDEIMYEKKQKFHQSQGH